MFRCCQRRKDLSQPGTLFTRFHPIPRLFIDRERQPLTGSRDTPIYLCHALRPRSGHTGHSLNGPCDAVLPYAIRKTPTIIEFSRFYNAASVLAAYASCRPYGTTTQCSLPAGGQPLPGGSCLPTGYQFYLSSWYGSINPDKPGLACRDVQFVVPKKSRRSRVKFRRKFNFEEQEK
jgi:hypothetical protein